MSLEVTTRRLLVVDDDPLILQCLKLALPEPEYEVFTAESAGAGLELFRQKQPDAVLLDVQLPDQSGLAALHEFRERDRRVPVILMTGHGTAETVINAMSAGAFEYVTKPFDPDDILPVIDSALETSRMARKPAVLPSDPIVKSIAVDMDPILGDCPAMVEVFRSIGRVASRDVAVLILGETGTGKEMIARAIYQHSRRNNEIFHAINCAAIPESLLESELFGHEKGTFTGADQRRIGKFETCDGGTLFLDEIGDMSPVMQTKLLRVLQEKEFERVGSNKTLHCDVRIIAATNHDLRAAMEDKSFRSDLYYRLNEFTIHLPPLRERGTDLPKMIQHFFETHARKLDKDFVSISQETMRLLTNYRWPGNVRELQGVIKQTLLRSSGPVITPSFLPGSIKGDAEEAPGPIVTDWEDGIQAYIRTMLASGEQEMVSQVHDVVDAILLKETLVATRGNISEASSRLGISRPTLRSRLKHLGLSTKAGDRGNGQPQESPQPQRSSDQASAVE